jgi:hypothetical protein
MEAPVRLPQYGSPDQWGQETLMPRNPSESGPSSQASLPLEETRDTFAEDPNEPFDDTIETPQLLVDFGNPAELVADNSSEGAAEDHSPKLRITINQATGLKHHNVIGDRIYCVCSVGTSSPKEACTTRMVPGSMDPAWDETLDVDCWKVGEDITFTILSKGTGSAKTAGTVTLPSEHFYPDGVDDDLPIEGVEGAILSLHVSVLPKARPGQATLEAWPAPSLAEVVAAAGGKEARFLGHAEERAWLFDEDERRQLELYENGFVANARKAAAATLAGAKAIVGAEEGVGDAEDWQFHVEDSRGLGPAPTTSIEATVLLSDGSEKRMWIQTSIVEQVGDDGLIIGDAVLAVELRELRDGGSSKALTLGGAGSVSRSATCAGDARLRAQLIVEAIESVEQLSPNDSRGRILAGHKSSPSPPRFSPVSSFSPLGTQGSSRSFRTTARFAVVFPKEGDLFYIPPREIVDAFSLSALAALGGERALHPRTLREANGTRDKPGAVHGTLSRTSASGGSHNVQGPSLFHPGPNGSLVLYVHAGPSPWKQREAVKFFDELSILANFLRAAELLAGGGGYGASLELPGHPYDHDGAMRGNEQPARVATSKDVEELKKQQLRNLIDNGDISLEQEKERLRHLYNITGADVKKLNNIFSRVDEMNPSEGHQRLMAEMELMERHLVSVRDILLDLEALKGLLSEESLRKEFSKRYPAMHDALLNQIGHWEDNEGRAFMYHGHALREEIELLRFDKEKSADLRVKTTLMKLLNMNIDASEESQGETVLVSTVGASGLESLGLSGDGLYCVCSLVDADAKQKGMSSFIRTQTLKDSEPHWNNTQPLELWRIGDAIEFKVVDVGSQIEARAKLESNEFVLDGFDGDLPLEDNASTHCGAMLHVRVCRGRMMQSSAWASSESSVWAGSVPMP